VIELAVVETNKGEALEAIRHRVGASAAIYIGDDVTDEDAFASLTGPDVGVKVGGGETRAKHRIENPDEAARVLAQLCEMRADWLNAAQFVPIDAHSMLSDQRTAALLAPGGRIVWYCAPCLDSPALFAELLGGPVAGHFTVRPVGDDSPGTQHYVANSMVVETKWRNVKLTDFLDCSAERTLQRAGRSDLVRIVEGTGEVELVFAPRLDFGRTPTSMHPRDSGLEIEDTFDPIVLFSPGIEWQIVQEGSHDTARARLKLDEQPLILELRYGTGTLRGRMGAAQERLVRTNRHWETWTESLRLPRVEKKLVVRSALVLKGLCYGPSGAIAAAATTSLPEHVGGVRNWDYRYCWLRDAALAATSLAKLGSFSEPIRFLDWVLGILDQHTSPERLHPVYTLTGRELPPEGEISELSGYRGSRPVRVGNLAANQLQLDVFGPIVELILVMMFRDAPLSSEHWRLVEAMVTAVSKRWKERDHGIWEVRTRRRHHVHSKVMCWVTVDRACTLADHYLGRPRDDWMGLRDRIREDVLHRGWNEEVKAYTATYNSEGLDAATLEIGLKGLIEPTDPRFVSTVERIQQELSLGPGVYRYRYDDGLPGFEGAFHLCTAWLVQALWLIGRKDVARSYFDQMIALAGPTGLLSEEYGPRTKRALGNHPQAYSHIGVIDCALMMDEDEG
jgi:GH15 family glucan-1,4-alpha-glucosidase